MCSDVLRAVSRCRYTRESLYTRFKLECIKSRYKDINNYAKTKIMNAIKGSDAKNFLRSSVWTHNCNIRKFSKQIRK